MSDNDLNLQTESLKRALFEYTNNPSDGTKAQLRRAWEAYQIVQKRIDLTRQPNVNKTRELQRLRWCRLLGEHLDEMLTSRTLTDKMLEHSDASIRRGALALTREHWRENNQNNANTYEKIAFADPDLGVREEALKVWSELYRGSAHVYTCHKLASLAKDSLAPAKLRNVAYMRLCDVLRIALPNFEEFMKSYLRDGDSLVKEIDWNIVEAAM